jgi:hypothetical protein
MTQIPEVSRRRVVSAFAATSATAWIAPSVLTVDRVAAAVGSSAQPALSGAATAGTLLAGQSLRPSSITWSSNSQFFVFEEQCVTLTSTQNTDSGMVLPTGVQITSHLIHFSPTSGSRTLAGSVNFSGTIIGYDWQDATLAAGDAQWGVPGVNYGVGRRRMEWPGNDTITFTLPGSVSLSMRAGAAFVDQIRIYVVY